MAFLAFCTFIEAVETLFCTQIVAMVLSVLGFASAALSPLAMTIGFIIWGKSWQATPFALNLFKCTLAGSIFMIISWIVPSPGNASVYQQSMVIFSSVIGIIIGDNTWLMALKMIGPKRVIVIDALKPFCAAFAGYFMLHEPLTLTVCLGLIVSSVGVVMVSTEKEEPTDDKEGDSSIAPEKINYWWGYTLAAVNVILDAFGSVLTKQFGTTMNTWEINYLRFGFAAVFMALLSVVMYTVDTVQNNSHREKDSSIEMSESRHALSNSFEDASMRGGEDDLETADVKKDSNRPEDVHNTMHIRVANEDDAVRTATNTSSEGDKVKSQHKWYVFPQFADMTPHQWASVTVGVMFVTFLCPAMSNYALFQLPLGLCLTLTSLGPVYSLPILCVLWGEKSGVQGIVGSILAVGGIAIMCL